MNVKALKASKLNIHKPREVKLFNYLSVFKLLTLAKKNKYINANTLKILKIQAGDGHNSPNPTKHLKLLPIDTCLTKELYQNSVRNLFNANRKYAQRL